MDSERPATRVGLRLARPADCKKTLEWRNDLETRLASFDSVPISLADHEVWFRGSLDRDDRKIFIVVMEGTDTGVVRLDVTGAEAEVSIHLAPEWRNRGVGTAALRTVADLAFRGVSLERLVARIKRENRGSLAAFLKAGFSVTSEGEVLRLMRTRNEGQRGADCVS